MVGKSWNIIQTLVYNTFKSPPSILDLCYRYNCGLVYKKKKISGSLKHHKATIIAFDGVNHNKLLKGSKLIWIYRLGINIILFTYAKCGMNNKLRTSFI